MNQYRKEANWKAICDGRDLLEEIEDLKENAKQKYEQNLRNLIAWEIKNPREIYFDEKPYR
jgi:hypothetical protein